MRKELNDLLRLRRLVKEYGEKFPGVWKQADHFRELSGRRNIPDWPEWCFLPMSAYYMMVLEQVGDKAIAGFEASKLAALGAWRVTQGVYRFDPDLYQALVNTPMNGQIPTEVLRRMPEWCVYIETPGLKVDAVTVRGVWLHLEYDVNTGAEELRFLMDAADRDLLYPFSVHLGPWPLETACRKALEVAQKNRRRFFGMDAASEMEIDAMTRDMERMVTPVLSLLLYLCAEEPDYGGRKPPRKPAPRRVRKGMRMFPPDQPVTWEVGARIGAALRKASQESNPRMDQEEEDQARRRPRAHIRRAHWHTYRVGPGRKDVRVRWLAPIAVNVEDEIPAVLRPVS